METETLLLKRILKEIKAIREELNRHVNLREKEPLNRIKETSKSTGKGMSDIID